MSRTPCAVLALALLLAAAGCAAPAADPGRADYRLADGYAARRPAGVAVLAVEGGIPETAAAALRGELRALLLDRRYAPLRDDAVDGNPGEFRPGGGTAVLATVVERWDDAALYGNGIVRATLSVRLHAAGTGEVLYEARLVDVRLDARFLARTMEDRPRSVARVAEDAADRLLAQLPPKGDG